MIAKALALLFVAQAASCFELFQSVKNGDFKISQLSCDEAMLKCTYNFTNVVFPNSDIQIELYYNYMSGSDLRFEVRVSKLGEQMDYHGISYQEDFQSYYILEDPNIEKFEQKEIRIHRVSEVVSPLYFNHGDYLIKRSKLGYAYLRTCPIFYFAGIGLGSSACIVVTEANGKVVRASSLEPKFVMLNFQEKPRGYTLFTVKNGQIVYN